MSVNIKHQKNWTLWRYEDDPKNPDRKLKVPYTLKGHRASTTNPNHRWTYEQAVAAYNERPDFYSGIGYVFDGSGIVGVDLDNSLVAGFIKPNSEAIVNQIQTYWEESPSGTGLHGFCKGSISKALTKTALGDGSYIEFYDNGRFFTFTNRIVSGSLDNLAAFPDFLVAMIRESDREPDVALNDRAESCWRDLLDMPRSVEGENGSGRLLKMYRHIIGLGLISSQGLALAKRCAEELSDPPWPKDGPQGWLRKWKTALQSAEKENDIGTHTDSTPNGSEFDVINQQTDESGIFDNIPDESEIEQIIGDPMPVEIAVEGFDNALGRYSLANDPYTEADKSAVLIQMVSMLGNVIGRQAYHVIDKQRHYPKVNVNLVGFTGIGRKGTAYDNAIDPFKQADEVWYNACVKTGLSSGEGIISNLCDPDEPEPTSEDTGPQLQIIVDKRLFLIEPEFGRVLSVVNRDGSIASVVKRQAFDNVPLGILTKQNSMTATHTHISIVGHITPKELKLKLKEDELHNGFANRDCWVWSIRRKVIDRYAATEEQASADQQFRDKITEQCTDAIKVCLEWLRSQQVTDIETINEEGIEFHLSMDAKREMGAFNKQFEEYLAESPLSYLLSRGEAVVLRVAMILAILDCSRRIDQKHVRAGIAIWTYCVESAEYIFGSNESWANQTLVSTIRRLGHKTDEGHLITPYELRKVNGFKNATDAERALLRLPSNFGYWPIIPTATKQKRAYLLYSEPKPIEKK